MRGQDKSYTPDELYGAFQDASADQILTIIARGYMWETETADVERAYRALCA